jgi:hypothetical protein
MKKTFSEQAGELMKAMIPSFLPILLGEYNTVDNILQDNKVESKVYRYTYDKQPISKAQFLSVVPTNWESEVVDGEYSWGYYRAIEITNN